MSVTLKCQLPPHVKVKALHKWHSWALPKYRSENHIQLKNKQFNFFCLYGRILVSFWSNTLILCFHVEFEFWINLQTKHLSRLSKFLSNEHYVPLKINVNLWDLFFHNISLIACIKYIVSFIEFRRQNSASQ